MPPRESERKQLFGKERLIGLSDGVFAIAMTLLVLDIRLPENLGDSDSVNKAFFDLLPQLLSYGLSFLLIAYFWSIHHRLMNLISKSNSRFNFYSLLFLFFITLLPLSTNFFGRYSSTPSLIGFYDLNLAGCTFTLGLMGAAALLTHGVISDASDRKRVRSLAFGAFFFAIMYSLALLFLLLPEDGGRRLIYYTWGATPLIGAIEGRFREWLSGRKEKEAVTEIASTVAPTPEVKAAPIAEPLSKETSSVSQTPPPVKEAPSQTAPETESAELESSPESNPPDKTPLG